VVRPPWNEPVVIKRLLDAGFHNFLMPFVESAKHARAAVAATRYPPRGIRGVSVSQRSNRFGTVPDYFRIIDDNIAVMVQIESRGGLEAIDAITAVDGVDGLFVGPQDLAAALGHLGNPAHPDVQAAYEHIFERAVAGGKARGTLAPVEADARRYMEWGRDLRRRGQRPRPVPRRHAGAPRQVPVVGRAPCSGRLREAGTSAYAARPRRGEAHATGSWKPPRWPVTSTTSPMKKSPEPRWPPSSSTESPRVSTPPSVTSALL